MSRAERKSQRATPRVRTRPAARLELHAPADAGPPRGSGLAGWIVIAAAAVALLWIAFRIHVIGDYTTESDFYGGYVDGARLIQQGHPDPSRYPVAGPGYDAALALVGLVVRDLFTAARLLSVASAVGILVLWRALLVRRAGADLALWTIAFLAANPVFTRYGYSATTDMFAIFLQAAALHALLGSGDRPAWFRGGALAALATLTRYNAVYLVAFGVVHAMWLAPKSDRPRGRAALALIGGFALVAGPWVAFSLASGFVPGADLFGNFTTFYMVGDRSRNVQDLPAAVVDSLEAARSFGRVAGRDPFGMVTRVLANVPDHLLRDGRDLLGPPVAITTLVGLALALAGGLGRALLPVWVAGALLFATLVPVFSSDRYSLAIAPMYLTMAAAAATARHLALRLRGFAVPLKWFVVLAPLALSLRANVALQARLAAEMPVEVFDAAAALKRDSAPGARVMTRKAHIGYYAGRPTVPFPRVDSLAQLGAYCRENRVEYMYVSWYEARLRPEFAYLVDTSAVVPGLTRVFDAGDIPGLVYRVGPDFGRDPDWFADPARRGLHRARANVRILPGPLEVAQNRVLIAAYELEDGRPAEALGQLRLALPLLRNDGVAWQLAGHALRGLGRMEEAGVAYGKALALHPGDEGSRLGLEWARRGRREYDARFLRDPAALRGEVARQP